MLTTSVSEITVYLGLEAVQRLMLDAPVITVGRNEDNDLVLRDAKVSRHHLRLVRQPDGTYIAEDSESANGTWIGDYRIGRIALSPGMTLRVGPFTLIAQHPQPVDSNETVLPNSRRGGGQETIIQGSSLPISLPSPVTPDWTLVVSDERGERRVPLTGESFTIGRSARCDLVLQDPNVSMRHASIERRGTTLTVVDDGSTNGTFLDGDRITTAPLTPGRVLTIGETRLVLVGPGRPQAEPSRTNAFQDSNKSTGGIPIELRTRTADMPPIVPVAITSLQLEKDVITIGRDAANDVPLPNPQVSRHHARLRRTGDGHVIEDLGSTNGTFVNGERITSKQLAVGDQIQISVFVITYNGATLKQVNTEGNIRLDAIRLNKWVSETKNLLQDISFSVYPREFVALVGTSGAGKSTLMDALNGQRPAQGSLLINGDNLYANYDAYRTTIGYVPQDDIIHLELSVFNALDYVARLRLPPDTSKEERHAHIESVLKELGLTERRDLPIQRLSGGQRKRVSIGVELLTKPSLFFLDEPTSGLDPATETNMMNLLRQLADQGRTILLITHATKNVTLCDLVIFLAKGGNLAYYGPPNEAPQYFGVESFEDIYPLLEGGKVAPEEWSKRYRESSQYRTYVRDRLAQYSDLDQTASSTAPKAKAPHHAPAGALVQRPSALRQFNVLVQRNAEIMRKNRASLIIVMMQAILVSTFLVILFSAGLFGKGGVFSTDVDRGKPDIATTVLFVMASSGIFIGLSNASKEFVKERHIYRRERAVNLKVAPYLWAKVAVLAVLGAIQAAIMIGVLTAGRLLPRGDLVHVMPTYARLYAAYFVTILIGIMFGLLVSALVNTVDSAVGSIVLVFMPQLIFSGHLLPVERMQTLAKGISALVAGRWIYDTLGNISALPSLYDRQLATWQGRVTDGTASPVAQVKIAQLQVLQADYRNAFTLHVWLHWGILGAFFVVTAILIYIALRRNARA